MPQLATQSPGWSGACEWLQCVDCGGVLEAPGDEALTCLRCQRVYPVRQGILETLQPLAGNNKVAADLYNSPRWPRFRFWERLLFWVNGGDGPARMQVLHHLPDLSGKRLLEVAIGDGSNLPLLPNDCEVFGNDIAAVQLANCRKRYAGRNLHLILGEAEKLPFRDHAFDHVLSLGGFNYFSDPLGSLREMARVARPGGWIVVADEVPDMMDKMLYGRRLGLPQMDRWFMARFMKLGPEFTDMIDRHRGLQLEPIVREVLDDWQIHMIWMKLGYCIVGRPRA